MKRTGLLAIMAAIIYSGENASNRSADVKGAVAKARDILKEVKRGPQKTA
jgi:hypothetical protein